MIPAYQKSVALFAVFCLPFSYSCQQPASGVNSNATNINAAESGIPDWLNRRITEFQEAKPTNPPVKIYRYLYKNQEVYYITGRCCDIPSEVLDATGKQLCQPDGGITGRGDGKCADFFQTSSQEKLLWEDNRN